VTSSVVLERKRLCFTRAVQLYINPLEHRIQVTGNIGIPKPDNAVSFLFQPSLTFVIALRRRVVVVMPAIELNDQTLCRTEEVHYVTADRRLTAEMRAFYRQPFQSTPERAFMRRRIRTQLFGCCAAD
jgi:hypothetical protein